MYRFDIFYLNIIIPVLLGVLLLFTGGTKNKTKLFLSVAMFNTAYVFLAVYHFLNGNIVQYHLLHGYNVAAVLFIYPSFNQYLRFLTGDTTLSVKLFYPGIIVGVLSAILFYGFLSYDDQLYFLGEYRSHKTHDSWQLQLMQMVRLFNLLVLFIHMFWCWYDSRRNLIKYQQYLDQIISNPWKIHVNQSKVLNLLFILMALICIVYYALNPAKLFGDYRTLAYPFYLMALIFAVVGAIELNRNPFALPPVTRAEIENEPEKNKEALPDDQAKLKSKLLYLFKTEKPFLNPNLTITDLVTLLGTNRSYLSALINSEFQQNFSGFINQYRVNEVKSLLTQNPTLGLEEAAQQSGFGSLSSMNRAFHLFEGQSARDFKISLRQSA